MAGIEDKEKDCMVMDFTNDKDLFEKMKKYLYSAVLGDILDQMGYYHQFLPACIRPMSENMVLVGRAMPVLEADIDGEFLREHRELLGKPFGLMLEALDDLKENEVYICSGASPDYALVGELMCTRMKMLKASGAVVNGNHRDTRGILELDFPCFSYGCYAQDQAPRGKVINYRVPVEINGVCVRPGDIVFGDLDGVLVIPAEVEQEVIQKAFEKAMGEKQVAEAIKSGMSVCEAFSKYGVM